MSQDATSRAASSGASRSKQGAVSGLEGAGAAFGLALVLGLAAAAPDAVLWAPIGLGALIAGAVLLLRPLIGLSLLVVGAFAVIESAEGTQLIEVLYFGSLAGYLLVWYGRRVLGSHPALIRSPEDLLAAALLVAGLGGGTLLGLLFGSPPAELRGDVLALIPLFLYFPVRDACAFQRRGSPLLLSALVSLGIGALLYMGVLLYIRVTTATMAWEVVDVRFAGFELPMLIPAVALLGVVAYGDRRSAVASLAVVGMLLFGIIVAKSRGFWFGWIFGAGVLALLVQPARRRPLVVRSASAAAGTLTVAALVAGPVLLALAVGVAARIGTITDAFSSDISLINRYAETEAVLAKAQTNPILGFGLGAPYRYYSLIGGGTQSWSFIHNGFAAVWLKWGVWGSLLLAALWVRAMWCGIRAARQSTLRPVERGMAVGLAAALAAVVLTAYTSNPFFSQIPVLCTTVAIGLAVGLDQRARQLR